MNFCKFTNETRNGIEDATANSGQTYLAALNGTASGGGYELALACDHILLVDDRSSAVSLPELPLLGVLPGTGGLTRVVDKRHVRRDLADYFATKAEGVGGKKAVQWRLVDEVVPRGPLGRNFVRTGPWLARPAATRLPGGPGDRADPAGQVPRRTTRSATAHVSAALDRDRGVAEITVPGPSTRTRPPSMAEVLRPRRRVLAARGGPRARRPDPRPAHQRDRDRHLGACAPQGDPRERVLAYDALLLANAATRLAGQRDRALPQADAEAAGRDVAGP